MTRYYMTPAKQIYRVRGAVADAFHVKDGWFPSVWHPENAEQNHGDYFRRVWALVALFRVWRSKSRDR